jgi:hypothetical protein
MTLHISLGELLADKPHAPALFRALGPNDPNTKPELPDEPRQNPDQPTRTPDESPAQSPNQPDLPIEFT